MIYVFSSHIFIDILRGSVIIIIMINYFYYGNIFRTDDIIERKCSQDIENVTDYFFLQVVTVSKDIFLVVFKLRSSTNYIQGIKYK